MRIIAGRHRGRAIRLPQGGAKGGAKGAGKDGGKDGGIRPTSDRAREAAFNILTHGLDWAGFDATAALDVFAGTGAYGLEALSRGCPSATFIDSDADALKGIRRNAAALGEARAITLLKLDAGRLPPPPRTAGTPCALAFLDPPYESGLAVPALQGLASRGWIGAGAICLVEVAAREPLAPPPGYAAVDERTYGAARLVFLGYG